MIKHAIQNHADSPLVACLHKLCEHGVGRVQVFHAGHTADIALCLCVVIVSGRQKLSFVHHEFAQMRINVIVILGIIFVVGRGYEQRIKIDDFHAQILQVIQFIHNALQIAAVKLPDTHGCRPFAPISHMNRMLLYVRVLIIQHIVGGIPVAEAVHQNLVHNGAFRPVGCMKPRPEGKREAVAQIPCDPQFVVKAMGSAAPKFKIIPHHLVGKAERNRIIIKIRVTFFEGHPFLQRIADQINSIYIILLRADANRHLIPGIGFAGGNKIFRFVRKDRPPVKYRPHLQDVFGYVQGIVIGFLIHRLGYSGYTCLSGVQAPPDRV